MVIRWILLVLVIIWRAERMWQTDWFSLLTHLQATSFWYLTVQEALNDTSPVRGAKDHVWLLKSAAANIISALSFFLSTELIE